MAPMKDAVLNYHLPSTNQTKVWCLHGNHEVQSYFYNLNVFTSFWTFCTEYWMHTCHENEVAIHYPYTEAEGSE